MIRSVSTGPGSVVRQPEAASSRATRNEMLRQGSGNVLEHSGPGSRRLATLADFQVLLKSVQVAFACSAFDWLCCSTLVGVLILIMPIMLILGTRVQVTVFICLLQLVVANVVLNPLDRIEDATQSLRLFQHKFPHIHEEDIARTLTKISLLKVLFQSVSPYDLFWGLVRPSTTLAPLNVFIPSESREYFVNEIARPYRVVLWLGRIIMIALCVLAIEARFHEINSSEEVPRIVALLLLSFLVLGLWIYGSFITDNVVQKMATGNLEVDAQRIERIMSQTLKQFEVFTPLTAVSWTSVNTFYDVIVPWLCAIMPKNND